MSTSDVELLNYPLELGRKWYWFIISGLIMLIGGIFALVNPLAASLTVEILIGWTFVAAGAVQLVQAFSLRSWALVWVLLMGVLAIFIGVTLLSKPIVGLISLTMLTAIFILVLGLTKIFYAFKIKPTSQWIWVLISGLISLALGIFILMNFMPAVAITLGVLLAIELLSNGVMLALLGIGLYSLKNS